MSSSLISARYEDEDVAPIFQVISDLERPSSIYSEYTDLVIHHRDDSDLSLDQYPTVIRVAGIDNLPEASRHQVVLRSSFRKTGVRSSRMRNSSGSLIVRPGDFGRRSKRKKRKSFTHKQQNLGIFSSVELGSLQNNNMDTISNLAEKSDCPTYEVPRDVITNTKETNKKTKRTKNNENDVQTSTEESSSREDKRKRKKATKKIIKKYEEMLETLLQNCKQKDSIIQKKAEQTERLKEKLKTVMAYNNQFADENDYMKKQHEDMKSCIEHYKNYCTNLEERCNKTSVENHITSGCANCSANEIANIKYEKTNAALNEDVLMLKNVVYRLNFQMSRYQEKLKHSHSVLRKPQDPDESNKNIEKDCVSMPSLPNFQKEVERDEVDSAKLKTENIRKDVSSNVQMVWGNVNSHTLGPLLNAYQESILEKDDLIRDYEKEFNRFTLKLKTVIEENDKMHQAMSRMGKELASIKEISGLAIAERDSLRKDCETLKEKNTELEVKLKEDTESYQHKIDTMSRDFTLVHQEYFKTKTGLATIQGKCQMLEDQNKGLQKDSQVPIKIHNMRIDECKKLFDELKQRFDIEKNKLNTRISILQEGNAQMEKRIIQITGEKTELENKHKNYIKIAKKCQQDLAIVRAELTATKSSRDVFKRRSTRAINLCRQLVLALNKTASGNRNIKTEKMVAQKEVMKNLDMVESKLREQEKTMEEMKSENMDRIAKLEEVIKEKDALVKAMKQHIEGERLKRYSDMNPSGKIANEIMRKHSLKIPPMKPARTNIPIT